ncbi:MAG: TIGR04283 family arsenosugar biosynthesis glycosyltransferase [Myxococcaceae bacterium]
MRVRPKLSVVIPVLNEESCIAGQLTRLAVVPGLDEVIVVDGGSADRTVELAGGFSKVRVFSSPRGRAEQMNAGARQATGEVLLFLHADVELPADAAEFIAWALEDPHTVAGAFRTWTVAPGAGGAWALLLHLADLRSRYSRLPYGDQGIFVRAKAFRAAGGFPDQPLMEDLELGRRLRKHGRIRTVPSRVRVSGRRFLARPFYFTLVVNLLPALYRLGVPPRHLAGLYPDAR